MTAPVRTEEAVTRTRVTDVRFDTQKMSVEVACRADDLRLPTTTARLAEALTRENWRRLVFISGIDEDGVAYTVAAQERAR